ncbi:MAG: hypothetical protein ACTSW4_02585 [Candidatus Ranarchaeia archaeon]
MGFEELVQCMTDFMAESSVIELCALVDRDGLILHAIDRKERGELLLNRISSAVSSLFFDSTERLGMPVRRLDFQTENSESVIGFDYGEGRVFCVKVTDPRSHALIGYLVELYRPRFQSIIQKF